MISDLPYMAGLSVLDGMFFWIHHMLVRAIHSERLVAQSFGCEVVVNFRHVGSARRPSLATPARRLQRHLGTAQATSALVAPPSNGQVAVD